MAIRGVEFTKYAQLSLPDESTTFDDLSLSIQTAAQVEDTHKQAEVAKGGSKSYGSIYRTNHSDVISELMIENEPEQFQQFNVHYTDRRFGRVRNRRSSKCGDNKRSNGTWNGKIMTCHECKSTKHLKFHKECPTEIKRRKVRYYCAIWCPSAVSTRYCSCRGTHLPGNCIR